TPRPHEAGSEAVSSVLAQPVAGAAHGLDRAVPDLAPQPPHVDVDDVRARLVGDVPGVLDQLEAGENLAGPSHQRLEERELLRREVDLGVAAAHLAARGIESEAADLEDGRTLRPAPPDERTQAGRAPHQRERLDEV